MLKLLHEVGSKVRGIGQLEQGAFGIGVGNDGPGIDLFPRGKNHAAGRPVFHANFYDFRAAADFRPRSLRG